MNNGMVASLVVVALIIGFALGTVFFPRTVTTGGTSRMTNTLTTTSTSATSSALVSIQTTAANIPAACVHPAESNPMAPGIDNVTTPAVFCVQLYYSSSEPLTLNLNGSLSIENVHANVDAGANFTVSVSNSSVTLGGPTDENEGVIIAYNVTAKLGASGTYNFGFGYQGGNWMMGTYEGNAQEPLLCYGDGTLVAGNGQPDYSRFGGCITYDSADWANGARSLAGIPYPLDNDTVYYRIVGVSSG